MNRQNPNENQLNMSKKKKSPWNKFVSRFFTRNRANREYTVPKDYLLSVADQLWRLTPSKEIIYNTLVGVYSLSFEKGYIRKGDDIAWFKSKQDAHFEEEWKLFTTYLDDKYHDKSGKDISFSKWKEEQLLIKANQNKK